MNLIWLLLKKSWTIACVAWGMGLVSGASTASLIAIVNLALTETQEDRHLLVFAFIALCLVQFISSYSSQILLSRLANDVSYQLRILLSQRVLVSLLSHLEEIGMPKLMAALTEDIASISGTITIIPFFCGNLAIVIGCLIYLGILSWQALLVFFGGLLLSVVSIQLLHFKAISSLEKARHLKDRLFEDYKTLIQGIKELKLNSDRRKAFFNEYLKLNAINLRNQEIAAEKLYAAAASCGNIIIFAIIGGFLFIFPEIHSISISVLSSYVLTIIFISNYLGSIIAMFPRIGKAKVALDKIASLEFKLEENAENSWSKKNNLNFNNWQKLEFKNLTYFYGNEQEDRGFTVGKINLTFEPGELIFIVGGNGSGKSTLAKLITGLYIPKDGEIYLDDRQINDKNRDKYRNLFSVVFNDFYLFERLIGFKNIDKKAEKFLKKLQLEHKVKIENGQLSTINLSQGQKKRLALLTAYLEDRPIYLFDEWAADQDPIFKEIFYRELLPELKARGKTVFAICHDDKYFKMSDRLIELDYGRAIENQKVLNK